MAIFRTTSCTPKIIVELCIALGTTKLEDIINVVNLPPSGRTFQPHMTDELIETLNRSAAQTTAAQTLSAVNNKHAVPPKIDTDVGITSIRLLW